MLWLYPRNGVKYIGHWLGAHLRSNNERAIANGGANARGELRKDDAARIAESSPTTTEQADGTRGNEGGSKGFLQRGNRSSEPAAAVNRGEGSSGRKRQRGEGGISAKAGEGAGEDGEGARVGALNVFNADRTSWDDWLPLAVDNLVLQSADGATHSIWIKLVNAWWELERDGDYKPVSYSNSYC